MKEPVVLYTLDRLEYSQEVLLYKEPKELSLTVWIIVTLFVALICWIVFGKMEETVRARGVVRPVSNISQVKNAVSGEITGLYYRPGERVEKGALLLKINSQVAQAKDAALKTGFEKLKIKIDGILKK